MLAPYVLLVSFLWNPSATADEGASCSYRFSALVDQAKSSVGGVSREGALLELARLEQVKVAEIFPGQELVQTGRRTSETRVKLDQLSLNRYRDHFDRLWDSRQAAGKIPSWDLKEYRAWLKKQADSDGPYPGINARELFEDYIADGGTLDEYLDFKYLEYLEKVKFARPGGENVRAAVESYLKGLDHNTLRHFVRAAVRRAKRTGRYATQTSLGLVAGVLLALPYTFVNDGLGSALIGQSFTSFFSDSAKKSGKTVKEWTSYFDGGAEAYNARLKELESLSSYFDGLAMDSLPRDEAFMKIDHYSQQIGERLPLFKQLVASGQESFFEELKQSLLLKRDTVLAATAAHRQTMLGIDILKATIAGRPDKAATPEEQNRLQSYQRDLENQARAIANLLADWMFYKQLMGEEGKLNPEAEQNFQMAYERYKDFMRPGRLADAYNQRLKEYLPLLGKYRSQP